MKINLKRAGLRFSVFCLGAGAMPHLPNCSNWLEREILWRGIVERINSVHTLPMRSFTCASADAPCEQSSMIHDITPLLYYVSFIPFCFRRETNHLPATWQEEFSNFRSCDVIKNSQGYVRIAVVQYPSNASSIVVWGVASFVVTRM